MAPAGNNFSWWKCYEYHLLDGHLEFDLRPVGPSIRGTGLDATFILWSFAAPHFLFS